MLIESRNNPKYKTWLKLKTARGRKKEGAFIIESHKLIADAALSGINVDALLVDEALSDLAKDRLIVTIEDRGLKADFKAFAKPDLPEPFILNSRLFRNLSEMESSDGVMAVCSGRLESNFEGQTDGQRVLILDRIRDPGNLGTLLRSAEAFNFKSVICIDSCDISNYKVLRASMGSAFRLSIYKTGYEYGLEKLEKWKSESSYRWYGGDMGGLDFRKIQACDKMALVIGNEGGGLSDWFKSRLDKVIKIPMQGLVESLNAAVSGSILMERLALSEKPDLI